MRHNTVEKLHKRPEYLTSLSAVTMKILNAHSGEQSNLIRKQQEQHVKVPTVHH